MKITGTNFFWPKQNFFPFRLSLNFCFSEGKRRISSFERNVKNTRKRLFIHSFYLQFPFCSNVVTWIILIKGSLLRKMHWVWKGTGTEILSSPSLRIYLFDSKKWVRMRWRRMNDRKKRNGIERKKDKEMNHLTQKWGKLKRRSNRTKLFSLLQSEERKKIEDSHCLFS